MAASKWTGLGALFLSLFLMNAAALFWQRRLVDMKQGKSLTLGIAVVSFVGTTWAIGTSYVAAALPL